MLTYQYKCQFPTIQTCLPYTMTHCQVHLPVVYSLGGSPGGRASKHSSRRNSEMDGHSSSNIPYNTDAVLWAEICI